MASSEEFEFSPDEFSGVARLFPLPNLVMFPQVMQPLRVFEPRYRALVEEALPGDKLLALALLSPGWEADYEGRPPLRKHACLCRLATYQRLPDGCFNVLLVGIRRVRLKKELPPVKLFRESRVELLEDEYPADAAAARTTLQRELTAAFKRILPSLPQAQEQLDQLLASQISLGMLTDIVAYTLDFPLEFKQRMLAETNVDRRAAEVIAQLECESQRLPASQATFPPDFSAN